MNYIYAEVNEVESTRLKASGIASSSYLKLLGEGVGGVELQHVLHKLLHCHWLVAV